MGQIATTENEINIFEVFIRGKRINTLFRLVADRKDFHSVDFAVICLDAQVIFNMGITYILSPAINKR